MLGLGMTAAAPAQAVCEPTTWDLTAGQTIVVGSIIVDTDQDNLYVTYKLDYPGATFGALHLWVGCDLAEVPSNPQGIPVPGQFPYKFNDEAPVDPNLTEHTFSIPISDITCIGETPCGASLPPGGLLPLPR